MRPTYCTLIEIRIHLREIAAGDPKAQNQCYRNSAWGHYSPESHGFGRAWAKADKPKLWPRNMIQALTRTERYAVGPQLRVCTIRGVWGLSAFHIIVYQELLEYEDKDNSG